MEFYLQSCVHRFHVDLYSEHWTAFLDPGEQLTSQHEVGNITVQYAVAVKNNISKTVGSASAEKDFAACFFSMVLQLVYSYSN